MYKVREIASVTKAVAHGDLTKKIVRPAKGEILELQLTINTMVDQLRTFASEVTRVARDVGTEGILGGQADVEGVQGMWNELTVKKKHRIMEIGVENGLPLISLVQSVRPPQAAADLDADVNLGRRILTSTIRRLSFHR